MHRVLPQSNWMWPKQPWSISTYGKLFAESAKYGRGTEHAGEKFRIMARQRWRITPGMQRLCKFVDSSFALISGRECRIYFHAHWNSILEPPGISNQNWLLIPAKSLTPPPYLSSFPLILTSCYNCLHEPRPLLFFGKKIVGTTNVDSLHQTITFF